MKKKLLKSASVIALSAVMCCGAAAAFTGCNGGGGGGNSATTISVSMFCSDNDKPMNEQNCKDWAAQYTQKLREDGTFTEDQAITISFSSQSDPDVYFDGLANLVASNRQPDVFYVSPKYVKAWSTANRILDISDALAADAENLVGERGIWEDALAFYGYSQDPKYVSGDHITFDEESGKFVTDDENKLPVGIYGLPKDYSNFGLGFNEVFFGDAVRTALTTKKTTDRTGVHGAEYGDSETSGPAVLSYGRDPGVVTDADGNDVPLINIGVPTYYKPYNFYKYATFDAAVAAGDPMACAVQVFTGGKGYCVTIPGWPGDSFAEAAADTATQNNPWKGTTTEIPKTMQDPNATYDTTQGYITYTYSEFSALTWAMTYYINTFDWNGYGQGGVKVAGNKMKNVYGSDQYDAVLYVLPWLMGNDVQYSDEKSTTALNPTYNGQPVESTQVGNATYTARRRTLNGEYKDVPTQYGINSEKFIETIGAFHAYGSDWNGNSNNAGDTTESKLSGFDLFAAGNCLFYGVGTWDASTLNQTDRDFLRYRLMPTPVSDRDFALAAYVKGADYQMLNYGDVDENGDLDPERADGYNGDELMANQLKRQDQWGARMDSVGYGVSATVANQGWKKDAAIDLVKWLTVNPDTQITLTYSGAQLPNFKYQCDDYYTNAADGTFAKMVTPDKPDEFNAAYTVAKEMYAAASQSTTKDMSIQAWLQEYHSDYVTDEKFNTYYANDKLSSLNNLGYAMRALYLVAYTKADRDLALRMQYGLNAARDSAMYTYNDLWITTLDPRGSGNVMAYDQQTARSGMSDMLRDNLVHGADAASGKNPTAGQNYGTPMWWCLIKAASSETQLKKAIQEEKDLL